MTCISFLVSVHSHKITTLLLGNLKHMSQGKVLMCQSSQWARFSLRLRCFFFHISWAPLERKKYSVSSLYDLMLPPKMPTSQSGKSRWPVRIGLKVTCYSLGPILQLPLKKRHHTGNLYHKCPIRLTKKISWLTLPSFQKLVVF